jgi:hypothetical protein
MMSEIAKYEPTGRFRPQVLLFAVVAAAGAVLVAFVYEMAMRLIPFIYLDAIIAFGFAAGCGFAGMRAMHLGHCRNRWLGVALVVAICSTACAASFFWAYRNTLAVALEKFPELTFAQGMERFPFLHWLHLRSLDGWSMRSMTISGWGAYCVWGVEVLLFVLCGAVFGWMAVDAPYCERCKAWCKKTVASIRGLGRVHASPLLAAADLDGLIALQGPARPGEDRAILLTCSTCPTCVETGFLSVHEVLGVIRNGKREEKKEALLEHAVLQPEQTAALRQRTI